MAIIKEISIDLNKPQQFTQLTLQQGEAILRQIDVQILNNGDIYTIPTDAICSIRAINSQKTIIDDECTIVNNKVRFTITQTMTALAERLPCQIKLLFPTTGDVAKTVRFHMLINPSVNVDEFIVTTGSYTQLDNALLKVDDWDKLFEEAYPNLDSIYATRLNGIDSQLADNATKVNANTANIAQNASSIGINASDINTQKARIDSFTALASGSTTGDAELIDGRTSKGGVTFQNIGDNVRSKIDDIKTLFAQIGDKKQVNGITRALDPSTTAITNTIILYADHDIKVSVNSGYRYQIFLWHDVSAYNVTNYISGSGWKTDEQTILKGSYYAIQFGKAAGTAIDITEISNLVLIDIVRYEKHKADIDNLQSQITKDTLYHILGTGQSLLVGAQGNPALSTLCPLEMIGKTFVFNGGARPIDGEDFPVGETGYLKDDRLAYLVAAHEQDNTLHIDDTSDGVADRDSIQGETISSALAYNFARLTGKKCLVSLHGFGGKSYNDLKKGTMSYDNLIRAVYNAKSIAERMGMNYEVIGVAVVHGENDSISGTTESQYVSYLTQWQSDFDSDIKAISGQTRTVKLYVSQTASASSYSLTTSPIPNAVFKASVQNANIRLVCPQYLFTYASVHMNNHGYRKLGEYFGNQIGRDFNSSGKSCLYPTKSVLSGTSITITVNSILPLTFDVGNVPQRSDGHYGFTINDSNGAVITGVSVSGMNVTITLDKVPASDAQIEYAYRPLSDEMGKMGSSGVRGNIRDTGGFTGYFDGLSRPNWLCIFSIPVTYN